MIKDFAAITMSRISAIKGLTRSLPWHAENLLKAQRAWIDYRDGQCEAEGAQFAGGSIRPLITISCKTTLTRKRTEELLQMMQEN